MMLTLRGWAGKTLQLTSVTIKPYGSKPRDDRSFEDILFMDDARSCMEEMLKAGRVYRDRFGEEPPDCGLNKSE
jgi:hypothetical protein